MDNKDNTAGSASGPEASGAFLDHMVELRKRILLAVLGVIIGCIITGIFHEELMEYVILSPAKDADLILQNLRVMGQLVVFFKVVLFTGIVVSFPWVLLQIWKFVGPGLYSHEQKWARKITWFTSLCFFSGVSFAYFVMLPVMMGFAKTFGTEEIRNQFDINDYFSFIITLMLGAGVVFELPMVSYVLSRAGIINAAMLRKYRRHAIVMVLILAAMLTPTPDPVNQLLMGAPIFVLYEISIVIAASAKKQIDTRSSESASDHTS